VIRDLLWGCVICGELEALRMMDRVELCTKCGARYRRGRGANITIEVEGRGLETRSAAEWTSQLPPVTATGTSECLLRAVTSDTKIRAGVYLGRVERFGSFHFGLLALTETALSFKARAGDDGFNWPLGELTAIQPSSTALQLKARRHTLVSIKFVNSSARLWERRLQAALRQHYRGREIIEFQPRITMR
jgi:hypothetical protein